MECPIHKVAKTDRITDNECQSCEFFKGDCPNDVLDALEDEMMESTATAVNKLKYLLKKHTEKK